MSDDWLKVHRGTSPLIVSFPHTGVDIPEEIERKLVSPWLARRDADWWIDKLYDFAEGLGATTIRTTISRTVIDVNRDPSGASLYPGQTTTGLCPTETFDGEALYAEGAAPDEAEIVRRRGLWFDAYHEAIATEMARLRFAYQNIILYDAHSIRSRIPRLFDGELPCFNIGTNGGEACDPTLAKAVEAACDASGLPRVTNGRFRGGYITRHYGNPFYGANAIQMELACRAYMDEPEGAPTPENWPVPYDAARAEAARATLEKVLRACLAFCKRKNGS